MSHPDPLPPPRVLIVDDSALVRQTMTDLLEVKAAILAAKENTSLPVFVTMTFEANGRTFEGTPIEAMVAVVEGLDGLAGTDSPDAAKRAAPATTRKPITAKK